MMTDKPTIMELLDQIALHATGGIDEIERGGKIPVVIVLIDQLRQVLTALETERDDYKRVLGELVDYTNNPPAGSFATMWAVLEGIAVEARKLLEVE